MHGLQQTYHRLRNHLDAPMVLLGDEAEVQARFGLFRDSANLDADRCSVCAERTIAFKIVLDAPVGTPR